MMVTFNKDGNVQHKWCGKNADKIMHSKAAVLLSDYKWGTTDNRVLSYHAKATSIFQSTLMKKWVPITPVCKNCL